jgi:hypothetical protein
MNRVDSIGVRNPGCESLLHDEGKGEQFVPVCMGGMALVGCNNPDACTEIYGERRKELGDDGQVHVIFRSEDQLRVIQITSVNRKPLVPVRSAER